MKIHPAVNVFPWLPLGKEAYEHQMIITDADEIFVNGKAYNIANH